MGRSRRKPSSPEEIALRKAQARAAERAALKDPASWGVDDDQLTLPANDDVVAHRGMRRRVLDARRLDAFDALYAGGGLTVAQHQAARRLIKDWAERAGIQTADNWLKDPPVGPQLKDHFGVSDRMMAAAQRIDGPAAPGRPGGVFSHIGRADQALLSALVEAQVFGAVGATTWWDGKVQDVAQAEAETLGGWRAIVARTTGDKERHAQGAVVRMACENLRAGYEAVDGAKR